MSEFSRDERVVAHIARIASRSDADAQVLVDALSGRSWPGGAADRIEPVALVRLRRRRPRGPAPMPLVCGCAEGRCLLCN